MKQVNKAILELHHFILKNHCELYFDDKEVFLILENLNVKEFLKLTKLYFNEYFDEGIDATIREDYISLEIGNLINYYCDFYETEYWINKLKDYWSVK